MGPGLVRGSRHHPWWERKTVLTSHTACLPQELLREEVAELLSQGISLILWVGGKCGACLEPKARRSYPRGQTQNADLDGFGKHPKM